MCFLYFFRTREISKILIFWNYLKNGKIFTYCCNVIQTGKSVLIMLKLYIPYIFPIHLYLVRFLFFCLKAAYECGRLHHCHLTQQGLCERRYFFSCP